MLLVVPYRVSRRSKQLYYWVPPYSRSRPGWNSRTAAAASSLAALHIFIIGWCVRLWFRQQYHDVQMPRSRLLPRWDIKLMDAPKMLHSLWRFRAAAAAAMIHILIFVHGAPRISRPRGQARRSWYGHLSLYFTLVSCASVLHYLRALITEYFTQQPHRQDRAWCWYWFQERVFAQLAFWKPTSRTLARGFISLRLCLPLYVIYTHRTRVLSLHYQGTTLLLIYLCARFSMSFDAFALDADFWWFLLEAVTTSWPAATARQETFESLDWVLRLGPFLARFFHIYDMIWDGVLMHDALMAILLSNASTATTSIT